MEVSHAKYDLGGTYMRPDLDKCTTECYRRGAGSYEHDYKIKFGGKVKVHPDPEHEYETERGGFHSSARHRHWVCKEFGDKLGALKGNIRKNVGRRWDDVFSEFCASLDRRGVSGHHIWTHLKWEVELNTVCIDGKVYYSTKKPGYRGGEVTGYYVHPLTGILEYKKPVSWKRLYPRKSKEIIIDVPNAPDWHYRQIDGLWFKLRETFHPREWRYSWKTNRYEWTEEYWDSSDKKSANKKEIAWIKQRILAK